MMRAVHRYQSGRTLVVGLGLISALLTQPAAVLADAGRFNVLFIAVDDLRPELGCYGADHVRSPNIDRLASTGILFNRAYCQQAVCSPSRTSLLLGRRPDTTRVYDLQTHFRLHLPDVITLPQHFKRNGYVTRSVGKIYHGRLDDPRSWSAPAEFPHTAAHHRPESLAMIENNRKRLQAAGDLRVSKVVKRDDSTGLTLKLRTKGWSARGPAWEDPDIADNRLTDGRVADRVIELLRENKEKRFFLAAGFYKPHLPFVAPKKYFDLYPPEQVRLARNPFPPVDVPPLALTSFGELRSYGDIPNKGPVTEAKARELVRAYHAAVSFVDAQIGRLIDELDRLDLRDNTVIILWGDHGWQLGEHRLWCKHTNFEIAARVPMIISAPGQTPAGAKSDALVEFVDIYPTLCALCALPPPTGLEGTSAVPVMQAPDRSWKTAAFSQYPRGKVMGRSMRTTRYRYTEWCEPSKAPVGVELYDHAKDPGENVNIAARPETKGLVAKLSRALHAGWRAALPEGSTPSTPTAFPVTSAERTAAPDAPNILFAIADDWSHPHAGAYGDKVVKTPTFDRLADEGVLFTNAYCAAPSCTPSRGAILTGQAIHRLEQGGNLWSSLPKRFEVYTDILEAAGYHVGYTRKGWGPGRLEPVGRDRNPAGPPLESFGDFLATVPADQPFCFWFGSQDPHRSYKKGSGLAAGMRREDVVVPPYLPDTPEVRSDILDYYVEVQRFDREVGEILTLIEAAGRANNTLVVMTSDNGWPFPRSKTNLYDSGARMPLVIRWPAKAASGRAVDQFVSCTDFAPSFLEAAGLAPRPDMTGRSFIKLLLGKTNRHRDKVFLERERHANTRRGDLSYPCRAVRTQEFLYIRNLRPDLWPAGDPETYYAVGPFGDIDWAPTKDVILGRRDDADIKPFFEMACSKRPAEELYDLRRDPHQINNVAGKSDYADTRKRLRAEVDHWMAKTGDPRAKGETDFWDRTPYYGGPARTPGAPK